MRPDESVEDYAARLTMDGDATFVVEQLRLLADERGVESAVEELALIDKGSSLLSAGEIERAFTIHQASVELFPNSSPAWWNLGELAIYAGNRELAQRSLERAIELDSNSIATWYLAELDMRIREAAAETQVMARYEAGEPTGLTGPYLGQLPPGLTPEVFAPGIVSTRGGHEFSCTFSPDGREFYFNRGYNIYVSHWLDDGWTAPEPVPFNSEFLDHEAHISADGRHLYFGSARPRDGFEGEDAYGIWVMRRSDSGWGPPEFLFSGMYVTTALNGNAYVTDIFNMAGGGLAVYRKTSDGYEPLEKLAGPVNSFRAAHPMIAPDERYLLFDGYGPGSVGGDDFYVSTRIDGGTWSEPRHIAEMSTFGSNMTASLSPDGRFLFYYANHDIYWVSAEILEPYLTSSAER